MEAPLPEAALSRKRFSLYEQVMSNPAQLLWLMTILLVAGMIIIPTAYLAYEAMFSGESISLAPAINALTTSRARESIVNTVIYVVGVTLISLCVGVPLAFLVERTDISPLAKAAVRLTVLVSVITPPFLLTMAYVTLLGPNAGFINVALRKLLGLRGFRGPFNVYSLPGVLLLGSPRSIAMTYLMAAAAFERLPPELEEVAAITGASRARVLRTVTLPLIRNAIFGAALVSVSTALAAYGSPHMLGYSILTLRIREAMVRGNFPEAASISVVLTLVSLVVLLLYRRSISKGSFATVTGRGYRPGLFPTGRAKYILGFAAILYGLLAAVLPIGTLLLVSFFRTMGYGFTAGNWTVANYLYVFRDRFAINAFRNSILLSMGAATISVLLTIVIGYITVRQRTRTSSMIDYISVIPLGISGTALAVALIMTFTNQPFRNLQLYGTLTILLVCYVIRFYPVALRPVQTSMMQISSDLEEAGRSAGATWGGVTRTITFPLVKSGLTAGWILVYLQSLTELSASIILRHIGTDTISTAIMDVWDGGGGYQAACAMAILPMLMVAVIMGIGVVVLGKSFMKGVGSGGC